MYPPQVICGGGCQSNARYGIYGHGRYPELSRPEGGCLYEEAWGLSVDMDVFGVRTVPQLAEEFFLTTLPWHYLNQSCPLQMLETAESYEVFFENVVRFRAERLLQVGAEALFAVGLEQRQRRLVRVEHMDQGGALLHLIRMRIEMGPDSRRDLFKTA